jgi:hypothetical protein
MSSLAGGKRCPFSARHDCLATSAALGARIAAVVHTDQARDTAIGQREYSGVQILSFIRSAVMFPPGLISAALGRSSLATLGCWRSKLR